MIEAIVKLATKIFDLVLYFFKRKNGLKTELESIITLYDSLQSLVTNTNIDRALILRTSNGGGIPNFKSPLYLSITHEMHNESVRSIKHQYQNIQADRNYVELVINILEEKEIDVVVSDLKEGLLKNAYEAEGINFSKIVLLSIDTKGIYYLSMSSKVTIANTAQEKLDYTLAINKLLQLFRRNR